MMLVVAAAMSSLPSEVVPMPTAEYFDEYALLFHPMLLHCAHACTPSISKTLFTAHGCCASA